MARTKAELGAGPRLSDYLSVGVLARVCPKSTVDRVLAARGKTSQRERDLPAYAVVYYVIALSLFMSVAYGEVLRVVLEGMQFLRAPGDPARMPGKSGISQARSRLSWEVMADLAAEVIQPVATQQTRGAWYRGLRVISLDGSTLDVADEADNARAFGYPGVSRGRAAYPQVRFVSLLENGTRILFGAHMGGCTTGEIPLAKQVLTHLAPDMLCLADRSFFGYALWDQAQATGSQLLWRLKKNANLPCEQRLSDGSYRSSIYPDDKARRHRRDGLRVRVIEYRLEGVPDAEPLYRLLTTLMDEHEVPASELAALYHQRWEIETALDEFKTHLRGRQIILRSKTAELVRQEFQGFLLAYFTVRRLIHDAALGADKDPDELSFLHAVRVVRRKLPLAAAIPP